MPPGEKLALQAFAGRLRAQDTLDRHGPDMSAETLYDWVKKATGSEAIAERVFVLKRKAELKSGQPVPGG